MAVSADYFGEPLWDLHVPNCEAEIYRCKLDGKLAGFVLNQSTGKFGLCIVQFDAGGDIISVALGDRAVIDLHGGRF